MPNLVDVLRSGSQLDSDGVMVRVSRQACEEGADMIEDLTRQRDVMAEVLREVAKPPWSDSKPESLLKTLQVRAQSVLDQFEA